MQSFKTVAVEEHAHGDTRWVAVRARGAEWSWLTVEEAAFLGRQWVEQYGGLSTAGAASGRDDAKVLH